MLAAGLALPLLGTRHSLHSLFIRLTSAPAMIPPPTAHSLLPWWSSPCPSDMSDTFLPEAFAFAVPLPRTLFLQVSAWPIPCPVSGLDLGVIFSEKSLLPILSKISLPAPQYFLSSFLDFFFP